MEKIVICKYCGNLYKSKPSLINHERLCKSNPNSQIVNTNGFADRCNKKVKCSFCEKECSLGNIKRHEIACPKNPRVKKQKKKCINCEKLFWNKDKRVTTCSRKCSNIYYRTGPSVRKLTSYRTICFAHHEKKCVICGEDKIVSVHHLNENKKDNNPENLIPLCPTHHQYWHSKHKYLVEDIIRNYIQNKLMR